jgi:hypothetical protein
MNFFEISSTTIAGIMGYASTLISNAMPLVVIIVGLGIGLMVLDHFLFRK